MEVICSYETSVDFQRTTRRYVPEDGTLHGLMYLHLQYHGSFRQHSLCLASYEHEAETLPSGTWGPT
jgi:hypothetical protein